MRGIEVRSMRDLEVRSMRGVGVRLMRDLGDNSVSWGGLAQTPAPICWPPPLPVTALTAKAA